MIAVETNVLVYSHRTDSQWYAIAAERIAELAHGPAPWAIPWPCVHEFFGIVTHPRIFKPPSTILEAVRQIETWRECPNLVLLHETTGHWSTLRPLLERGNIVDGMVHDAKIAALCLTHGVRELWSADRDFSRFPSLKTRNPLIP